MLKHVALAALAGFAAYTLRDLGIFHEPPQPTTGSCRLLPGSDAFSSSEDMQEWADGTVIVTAGDLRPLFNHGVESARPGALYAVDLAADEPSARALPLHDFPAGLRFQPHGFHIRRPYIYCVSHAGGAVGSRLEVFEEITDAEGRLAGARWVRSVTHPLLEPNGFPNDVVAVAPGEVYVTNWLARPYPAAGIKHPSTWERVEAKLLFIANVLRLPITRLFRCTFDVEGSGPTECNVVGGRHPKANGIAEWGGDIFVVDSLSFFITIYARADNGDLVEKDRIRLPHATDNLDILEDGTMVMGAMPKVHECVDVYSAPTPGALTLAHVSNGSAVPRDQSRGVRGLGDARYLFRDVVQSDGTILNQISGGVTFGRRALLGSPWDSGALLCTLAKICFSRDECHYMAVH